MTNFPNPILVIYRGVSSDSGKDIFEFRPLWSIIFIKLIIKIRRFMKQKYQYINQAKQILNKEEGVIYKNWGGKLPVALVWPNSYRVGMSSLALHSLYRLFNDQPDVACERLFFGYQQAPAPDEP